MLGSRKTFISALLGHTPRLDTPTYPLGVKVPNAEMDHLLLTRAEFHGDWTIEGTIKALSSTLRRFTDPFSRNLGGVRKPAKRG